MWRPSPREISLFRPQHKISFLHTQQVIHAKKAVQNPQPPKRVTGPSELALFQQNKPEIYAALMYQLATPGPCSTRRCQPEIVVASPVAHACAAPPLAQRSGLPNPEAASSIHPMKTVIFPREMLNVFIMDRQAIV